MGSVNIKFTVCICTHNGQRFISEQIESILHQTMLPYEILVLDDDSEDDTLQILETFANQSIVPFKIIQNTKRLGLNKNFEQGILQSKGTHIAFSDQDDIWYADKLEIACKTILESSPDYSLWFFNSSLIHPGSSMLSNIDLGLLHFINHPISELNNQYNLKQLEYFYKYGNPVSGHNMIIDRAFCKSLLPILDNSYYYYDAQLFMSAAKLNKVSYIPKIGAYYRQHDSQYTKISETSHKNLFIIAKNRLNKYKCIYYRLGFSALVRYLYLNARKKKLLPKI